MTNELKKLKIKCENYENGCHDVVPYDEVETHLLNCPYIKTGCTYAGCRFSGNKLELEKHLPECPLQTISCDKCLLKMTKASEHDHNCIKALSERLAKMESIFEDFKKREEEEDLFKSSTGGIVRFIQPPEY